MESAAIGKSKHYPVSAFLWLTALLALVACLGLFAYRRLERIVNTAEVASRSENNRLLEVRRLVSDLYDAENEAMQYNIDRSQNHLRNYLSVSEDLRPRLALLAQSPGSPMSNRLNAELARLGAAKLDLLDSQLSREEVHRTDKILEQLSISLHRASTRAAFTLPVHTGNATDSTAKAAVSSTAPSSKDGRASTPDRMDDQARVSQLYRWMLGASAKNEPASQPAASHDSTNRGTTLKPVIGQATAKESAMSLPPSIETQLKSLKNAESAWYRENLEAEMQSTVQNQAVSDSIRTVVADIEQYERSIMASSAQEVAGIAGDARDWMVGFCVACSIFLALIAMGIVSFVRTTKRQHQSTEAAKLQAEALADTRARFIATMSHELRTPLHAILGFTDRILRTPLQAEQASQLSLVKRAADHLHSVANTVLEFSRLQAHQVQYEMQEFHLGKEVGLVLDLLLPQFEEKGIALEYLPTTTCTLVTGDALRLRQVLLNLLNNSLKFTAHGSVTLSIQDVASNHPKERHLRFEVRDTGMGIPAERLHAVFNAFEQSDASISRRFGGSGLGLAITKMLVEQQGGAIGIESTPGEGTAIWFELPFAQVAAPVAMSEAYSAACAAPLRGKVALIADDEPYNRVLLRTIMEGWGLTCVEAPNGLEATFIAAGRSFDYILLDLHMPEMDGWQATRCIREQGASKRTPIIILSATTREEDMKASIQAGASHCLVKPFREADLLQSLLQYGKAPSPAMPHLDCTTQFSLQALEQISGQNPAFVREMVNLFIDSAQACRRSIHLAFESRELQKIGEAAHKLAAPAKQLKAMNLHRILKAFEDQAVAGSECDHLSRSLSELDEELKELIPALQASMPR